jgi:hypothetical protein
MTLMSEPDDPTAGRPPVVWPVGTVVRVVPSQRHRNAHTGVIRAVQWHFKHECWHYYIKPIRGRMVYTRYIAEDLEEVEHPGGTDR